MVIKHAAAGGYSIVSLLDASEQRPLLSRKSLLVLTGVISAHVLALVCLRYQSFSQIQPMEPAPEAPPVEVSFTTLPADKLPAKTQPVQRTNDVPTPRPTQSQATTPDTPLTLQGQPTSHDGPVVLPSATPQPPATPSPPRIIRNPDWLSLPSVAEMADVYPFRAMSLGKTGKVVLACAVTTAGSLSDCAVADESPANDGFGAAALKLSKRFRMSPRSEDGQPVGGALVRIPISFTLEP